MAERPRFCIIGGGLAGGRAAEALRELGFPGEVVLLTEEPRLPHERPPLSKDYLLGRLPAERLLTRPPEFYADNAIEVRTGTRVTDIDPRGRVLSLLGGDRLHYDRLLLAPGSEAVRPRIPGSDLEGVETLRTVEDADRIRSRLTARARVLILGAGFLGSEVAATARQMGCEVVLVEARGLPLMPMGSAIGSWAAAAHREQGVEVVLSASVTEFRGGRELEQAVLSDGSLQTCQLAVVCVGARPRVDLAIRAGLRVDDGVLVDAAGFSSVPEILAAGDVARFWHPALRRSLRLEHWDNAQLQGRHAAEGMLGGAAPYAPLPYFWTELYGAMVQQVGLWEAGRPEVRRGSPGAARFSLFQMEGRRVVACVAVNRFPDLKQARILITAGREVDPSLLADPDNDLKGLAGKTLARG